MIEKTLHEKAVYTGKIIRLKELKVSLPDGSKTTREVIDHNPAVVILPFKTPDTVCLIKQFRISVDLVLLEVPAGLIECNEDPLKAASRELREETGFLADQFYACGQSYPTPGFCNELLHFYIATGLVEGQTELDQDEFIELYELSLSEMKDKIDSGEIKDTKTILSYFNLQDALARGVIV